MYKVFLFVAIALGSGCAKDHTKPPANIDFVSVKREKTFLYDIRYQSDIDVLDLFGRGERVGMVSGMLRCALADDHDFTMGTAIQFSAFGLIRSDENAQQTGTFSYLTRAFMVETSSDRSSERNLSVAELNHLLSNKQQIPCKVVVTAYGYKPYYSNTLHIPVADLLREINKPR